MKKYRGVFPALYACFDESGRVDARQVRRLTRWLLDCRVSGLYVNGSPGESAHLSLREKIEIMENVMAEAEGRLLVLCSVSADTVEDSVELAQRAAACGADAVVAGPGVNTRDTLETWRLLSAAANGCDTIFYNAPLPGIPEEKELFSNFVRETGVKGIIPADAALTDIALWRDVLPDEVSVFTAREKECAPAIAMGADAVTGWFCMAMPELMVRLESTIRYAGLYRAAPDQNRMLQVCSLLDSCKCPPDAARHLVEKLSGIELGRRRSGPGPLLEADRERAEKAWAILTEQ